MHESENKTMNPDEELVDILLDFIIVAANLAKSINRSLKPEANQGRRQRQWAE